MISDRFDNLNCSSNKELIGIYLNNSNQKSKSIINSMKKTLSTNKIINSKKKNIQEQRLSLFFEQDNYKLFSTTKSPIYKEREKKSF